MRLSLQFVVIQGYSGELCSEKIDPCATFPCENGVCVASLSGSNFTCNCTGTGFYGELCDKNIDECSTESPCKNGAQCLDKWGSYICNCLLGYEGSNCEKNIDDCALSPAPCGGQGTYLIRILLTSTEVIHYRLFFLGPTRDFVD